MEWKDPGNSVTDPEKTDPYYDDDGYGTPPKKGGSGLSGHPFRFLYAGVGVAVIIGVVLLAAMFFFNDGTSEETLRLEALIERIEQLEQQLEKVSQTSADQARTLETLKRSEAAAALRMDHITTSLDSLQNRRNAVPQRTIVTLPPTPPPSSSGKTETAKPVTVAPTAQKPVATKPTAAKPATPQPTAAPPPPAATRPAEPRPTAPPSPAATTARPTPAGAVAQIHVVAKGDTLYNISRRYNLTVQQLRTLNSLGDDAVIRMGQKLVVQPAPAP